MRFAYERIVMNKNFLVVIFVLVIAAVTADAQVVLDGTMGAIGEVTGPLYDIKETYGQKAGANLFHSFSQFDINTGETANFGVSSDVQNIISRVTGGSSSWIDGTLQSTISGTSEISGANLYLLNPSGVLFGPNATLNLGGSFHVSTADYLRMGENERFYAVQDTAVLSVAPPTAFGFLSEDVKKITFQGPEEKSLTVSEGKTISLIGGNIEITGTSLNAPEGRINIAGAASSGEAVLTESGIDILSFQKLGTITISDNALIQVSGKGSGDIFIRGGIFLPRTVL